MVTTVFNRFPELTILINNAGVQIPLSFSDGIADETCIDLELATNLIAPIKLSNRMLPLLCRQKSAALVFVGSALASVPKYGAPVYSSSKAAMHSFAQSLRAQLKGSAVQVFEVIPDLVDTAMTAGRHNVKKIQPEKLAATVMEALKKNRHEILIGRTSLLYAINRLSPKLARRIINQIS